MFEPAGTPEAIVGRLNTEITAVLQAPEMQKRLRELGAEPATMSPTDYGRYVREESEKWTVTLRQAGLAH